MTLDGLEPMPQVHSWLRDHLSNHSAKGGSWKIWWNYRMYTFPAIILRKPWSNMRQKGSLLIRTQYQIWAHPFRIKAIQKYGSKLWSWNQIKNDPGEFDPFVDIDPKTDQNDPNWIKSDPQRIKIKWSWNRIKNGNGEFDPFVEIDPKTDQNDPNLIKSDS